MRRYLIELVGVDCVDFGRREVTAESDFDAVAQAGDLLAADPAVTHAGVWRADEDLHIKTIARGDVR